MCLEAILQPLCFSVVVSCGHQGLHATTLVTVIGNNTETAERSLGSLTQQEGGGCEYLCCLGAFFALPSLTHTPSIIKQ